MSYVKSHVELGLKTDTTGIYIMTDINRIKLMQRTGSLGFGIGDAPKGTIAARIEGLGTSKTPSWEIRLLDTIPNPGYRDHKLHKIVRQYVATQLHNPRTNRHSEIFEIPVEKDLIEEFSNTQDFEPIRLWLNAKIRSCAAKLNPDHAKPPVNLRNIQQNVIDKVLSSLAQKGLSTNFVCELAARIGKTILFLELAKNMKQKFGHKSMFIMAYGVGLSVKASYKDEIGKYSNFSEMQFIDASDKNSDNQYKQAIGDGKMPIVFVSLNPEAEEKYEWINQLTGTHIALSEETDFGNHTDNQVEKVKYILGNKTVTRFNASGTNIGRIAKAFGENAIDEIISVPYCMVEQDDSIPNVVKRNFYNMLFSEKINKLLEDYDNDVLPNITKILAKPLSQQKFISALFKDIFGYDTKYGFNISDQAKEEILHSMLFVGNIGNSAMGQLATVIEKACPEHKVLILNGDNNITNKEAEGITKEELVRLKSGYYKDRDKLLVITNMMGTRSYSIPEIQACLFMQEGGDVYPYMQKYSRCLTPGFDKKFGYIFDFAFDQSKTRNSVLSVAVEAALLIREKGKTYPEAVRKVLNSVNIMDVVSGHWTNADDIIKQFEDNNKLLEIANAHTRITIDDLTQEEIEAFGELAKKYSGSKAEKSSIDKIVETGKTYEYKNSNNEKTKKTPLKAIVEKAIRMINESATTVLALSDYRGESFLECIDFINDDLELSNEFNELYGVRPETIKRLADRLEISTLDIIVRMSKYNESQKHIENNSLAILKDDVKLWHEIFENSQLNSFINSKECKTILVMAGGHGSEIDALVEMFGVDIVKKIVYNDKYGFLCNQIKRKYPLIRVEKGDFTELRFDNMKFDLIIGNPPYQQSDGGHGASATPIYQNFIEFAKNLKPEIISMVVPSRWMAGGRGLDTFRKEMMEDKCLKIIVDYPNSDQIFPTTKIAGGIQYFIWDKNHENTKNPKCLIKNVLDGKVIDESLRDLNEYDIIIRFGKDIPILKKIQGCDEPTFDSKVSAQKPFGLRTNFKDYSKTEEPNFIKLYVKGAQKQVWVDSSVISKNTDWVKKYKVLTSAVAFDGSGVFPSNVINKSFVAVPNSACTETYLVCGLFDTQKEAENLVAYMKTRLFRFLVSLRKNAQHLSKDRFKFVPDLPMTEKWTDDKLCKRWNISKEEFDYISSRVKEMN